MVFIQIMIFLCVLLLCCISLTLLDIKKWLEFTEEMNQERHKTTGELGQIYFKAFCTNMECVHSGIVNIMKVIIGGNND